jgi:hypothetical protein
MLFFATIISFVVIVAATVTIDVSNQAFKDAAKRYLFFLALNFFFYYFVSEL